MKFQELNKTQFEEFYQTLDVKPFLQSYPMHTSLHLRNQTSYLVGVIESSVSVAALIIVRELRLGLKRAEIQYGPIGKTNDPSLLSFFFKELESFLKKKGVIELQIAPYEFVERYDNDFELVETYPKSPLQTVLENQGYTKMPPVTVGMVNHWIMLKDMSVIDSQDALIQSYQKNVRNRVRRHFDPQSESSVSVLELTPQDLHRFIEIEQHTGERQGFDVRNSKYFESLVEAFGDQVKILIATIDLKSHQQRLQDQHQELKLQYEEFLEKPENPHQQKQIKHLSQQLESLEKQLDRIQELRVTHPQDLVDMASRLYIINDQEVTCLAGGSWSDFDFLNGTTAIYHTILEYTRKHQIPLYNYFGLVVSKEEYDRNPGVINFKRAFGGDIYHIVDEYIKVLQPLKHRSYEILKKALNRK